MLKKADLSMDDAMAEALAQNIDTFERADRMLASSEARRNNALREIDRHREVLGDAMRRAVDEVEDAEFRDVETGEASEGSATLMTDRQQRANRANAKSSTGPKTVPGKARSAQNAFRHGLNISVLSEPALASLAEEMAHRIAGPDAYAETLECARRIAEAQVDLSRVRDCRRRSITTFFTGPNLEPLEDDEMLAAIVEERASRLAAFDRYERRALSRRKFAIRRFDACRGTKKSKSIH